MQSLTLGSFSIERWIHGADFVQETACSRACGDGEWWMVMVNGEALPSTHWTHSGWPGTLTTPRAASPDTSYAPKSSATKVQSSNTHTGFHLHRPPWSSGKPCQKSGACYNSKRGNGFGTGCWGARQLLTIRVYNATALKKYRFHLDHYWDFLTVPDWGFEYNFWLWIRERSIVGFQSASSRSFPRSSLDVGSKTLPDWGF